MQLLVEQSYGRDISIHGSQYLEKYSKGLTPTVANAPRVCLSFDFKLGQIEALLEGKVVDYRYSNTNTDTRKALLSIYVRQYMKQQNGSIPAKCNLNGSNVSGTRGVG